MRSCACTASPSSSTIRPAAARRRGCAAGRRTAPRGFAALARHFGIASLLDAAFGDASMRNLPTLPPRARLTRNVYFAAFAAALPLAVGATTIAEFPVSQPALGITQGPDHNLWF